MSEPMQNEAVRLYREVLEIASRRWRAFLVVFVTVAVAVQVIAFLWPGTYAALAALELQKTRFNAPLAPDRAAAPTLITSGVTEEEVNSQIAVLTSQEVLESVVREAGLDRIQPRWYMRILLAPIQAYNAVYYWYHDIPPPDGVERAVRSLRGDLTADRVKDSNVLAVTYEAGDPRYAQGVLDLVIKRYLEHQLQPTRSRGTETFFDEQAQRLQAELSGYEDALLAIQQKTGGGDIKGELDVRLALDAELRKEDWTLRRQAAELDEKIASYRDTLAGKERGGDRSTTTARNDAALQLLQDQLLKLELEGVHLAENYAPGSPSIVDNQRKIEVTRNAIATQQKGSLAHRTVSTSPARLGIESELEQALAQRRGIAGRQVVLDGQLARSRESLAELDVQALQATRLQRLIAVTADRYATYLKSGEAARIDSALDAGRFSNVIVVQDAAASSRPVKPKKLITLLVSVLGGVLAGLGTCAWLELKRTGFERVFGSLMAGPVGAS